MVVRAAFSTQLRDLNFSGRISAISQHSVRKECNQKSRRKEGEFCVDPTCGFSPAIVIKLSSPELENLFCTKVETQTQMACTT